MTNRSTWVGLGSGLICAASFAAACGTGVSPHSTEAPPASAPADAVAPAVAEETEAVSGTDFASALAGSDHAGTVGELTGALPEVTQATAIADRSLLRPVPQVVPLLPGTQLGDGDLRVHFGLTATQTQRVENLRHGREMHFNYVGLRVVDRFGQVLSEEPGQSVDGQLEGALARFIGVHPDADLSYTVQRDQLRQELVLHAPPAGDAGEYLEIVDRVQMPSDLRIVERRGTQESTHLLPLELATRGALSFYRSGEGSRALVFALPAAVALDYEERIVPVPRAERLQAEHVLRLDAQGAGEIITRVPLAQLRAAATRYPVYIDPSLSAVGEVTISSLQLTPTVSGGCDVVLAATYGNWLGSTLNVSVTWGDDAPVTRRSRVPLYEIHRFDASECPGSHLVEVEICDDAVPADCDRLVLPVHPGSSTATPQSQCQARSCKGTTLAVSTLDREECARVRAEAFADDGGAFESSVADPEIVINEIRYLGPGDDAEVSYIELSGPPGASLDGWQLETRDGSTGLVRDGEGGWWEGSGSIPASGYFVICAPGTTLGPACDAIHPIGDLPDGPGDALILRKAGQRQDALLWGGAPLVDTNAGEGFAAPLTDENSVITRKSDGGDNAQDFVVAAASPGHQCGDGQLGGPEQCDDGNLDDGDGCDSACQDEADACHSIDTRPKARWSSVECVVCDSCLDGELAAAYRTVELNPARNINGTIPGFLRARANSAFEALAICQYINPVYTAGKWGGAQQGRNNNGEVVAPNANPGSWYGERKSHNFLNSELHCWVAAVCGDGFLRAGHEACDDGNLVDGDGCDSDCSLTGCGNGIVTAGEECDDGNLVDGDGCDASCLREVLPCELQNPTAHARFADSFCVPQCDSCLPGRQAAAYTTVELNPARNINGTRPGFLRARANSDAEALAICRHLWSGYSGGKWGGARQGRNNNGEVVAPNPSRSSWYGERKSHNFLNTELHCWVRP